MKIKHAHLGFGFGLVFISNLFVLHLSAQVLGEQYISFSSDRAGNLEIYIIDTNGGNLRNLTNHPAADHSATWAPDGRSFAYVSHRDGNGEIYVMDLNKQKTRRLTNDPARDDNPAWSPDGKWIAFSSNRKEKEKYHIYKMDVKGENLKQLTNAGRYNSAPAWAPDSRRIAFYSIRNESGNVYIMDANGRGLKRLTIGIASSWAPDGKQIAYYRGTGIYVIDANGQNSRRVSPLETWSEEPAWSPDGKWIAYESELENPWGNPNRDPNIYLISTNGGKPRQLTRHPGWDSSPAWVPDGFLAVSPTAETRTILWGALKKPAHATK